MSEASMWGRVRKALSGLDPVRIENRLEKGTPDVNLCGGEWIELKWQRRQPKNQNNLFVIEHYTQEQATWAARRSHVGGKVFVLLKISQEWLLFRGDEAAKYLNQTSLNELRTKAIGRWVKTLKNQELKNLLLGKN